MWILLQSLFTGFVVGILFTFFRLPLPAPPVLAGVVGIIGIYLGYIAVNWWRPQAFYSQQPFFLFIPVAFHWFYFLSGLTYNEEREIHSLHSCNCGVYLCSPLFSNHMVRLLITKTTFHPDTRMPRYLSKERGRQKSWGGVTSILILRQYFVPTYSVHTKLPKLPSPGEAFWS